MTNIPQTYLDHLNAITADANPEKLRDVWEVDGVLEFPYGQSLGIAPRVEGIDAIIEYFSGLGYFRDFTFSNMRGWPIADAPEYVVEMHGSATLVQSGNPYEQDYIVRFGLGPSQKLSWMREYWDATRVGSN
jgi:hypothetical protein